MTATLLLAGCATKPYDYTALQASKPKSIAIIPPLNNSTEVNAPYIFLSTITVPLAEKGYYVFPVAVVDQLFKENGVPTTAEMNAAPLEKVHEVIGADAVLYVTINDWGQKYQVLSSVTIVDSDLKLVDGRTGEILWQGKAFAQKSSGDSGGGVIGALVTAVVQQIATSMKDQTPQLSSLANSIVINNGHSGLLPGPYREAKNAEMQK